MTAIGIGRESIPARTISAVGEDVRVHADRATRIWIFSSIFWLGFVDLVGLVMALELVEPNLLGGIPWLLFSRIRPIHVNGVIFAWLSAMYFGGIFYMLPRLLGLREMWSERLGVWTAWLWNLMFVLSVLTLASGLTQAREYWELIWPLDVLLAAVVILIPRSTPR